MQMSSPSFKYGSAEVYATRLQLPCMYCIEPRSPIAPSILVAAASRGTIQGRAWRAGEQQGAGTGGIRAAWLGRKGRVDLQIETGVVLRILLDLNLKKYKQAKKASRQAFPPYSIRYDTSSQSSLCASVGSACRMQMQCERNKACKHTAHCLPSSRPLAVS